MTANAKYETDAAMQIQKPGGNRDVADDSQTWKVHKRPRSFLHSIGRRAATIAKPALRCEGGATCLSPGCLQTAWSFEGFCRVRRAAGRIRRRRPIMRLCNANYSVEMFSITSRVLVRSDAIVGYSNKLDYVSVLRDLCFIVAADAEV